MPAFPLTIRMLQWGIRRAECLHTDHVEVMSSAHRSKPHSRAHTISSLHLYFFAGFLGVFIYQSTTWQSQKPRLLYLGIVATKMGACSVGARDVARLSTPMIKS